MSVTEKLLRVFRVDQQLDGLQGRLRAAERFFEEQSRQVQQIDAKRDAINAQLRQLQASTANYEGEIARVDGRIEALREQMNAARTTKEYKAFLTEVNTLKAERSRSEEAALELMTKADELKAQLADLENQRGEREKLQKVAADDKAKRAEEIKDRLSELQAQRERLAAEVPPEAMNLYRELVRRMGDEAMAPVEEQDRRRHEYTCGSCMMAVPVETVSALMTGHALTRCVSCGCILFMGKEEAEALQPASSKR